MNLRSLKFAVFNCRSICNKTAGVLELLKDNDIDVCFVTESWLKSKDVAKYAEIHDFGYDIHSAPRRGRGGGVAFIFNPKRVKLVRNSVSKYSSFEVLEAVINTQTELIRLCVVYRCTQATSKQRYQETKLALFIEEFSEYIDNLNSKAGKPIICGDFNFHVEHQNNSAAQEFVSLYENKGFNQHVNFPTHNSGGTRGVSRSAQPCRPAQQLYRPAQPA